MPLLIALKSRVYLFYEPKRLLNVCHIQGARDQLNFANFDSSYHSSEHLGAPKRTYRVQVRPETCI